MFCFKDLPSAIITPRTDDICGSAAAGSAPAGYVSKQVKTG